MESFRLPNFQLMARVLFWLVRKYIELSSYDPRFETSMDLTNEIDRVEFVKSIATFIVSWTNKAPKTQIKFNTRNLYKADATAVRELLKISDLLSKAKRAAEVEDDDTPTPRLDISSKITKLKLARQLTSTITEKGAELHDLLGKECALREVRKAVISKPFELIEIEKAVNDSINEMKQKLTSSQQALENSLADEANLLTKIDKKKQEFERAEKRLKALQSVRPAYMDEYEKIEQELVLIYQDYIDKFRNLAYLEQQLDDYNRMEQDRIEETDQSLKRMQSKLKDEEMKLMREESDGSNVSLRPNRPSGNSY
jgi:clusterin-associated protein 1